MRASRTAFRTGPKSADVYQRKNAMSGFDMPPDEFRRYGYEVVDWIASYLENAGDLPVCLRRSQGR